MLLYPPVSELADKVGSRYQLVNVIAQRAREISAQYEAMDEPLDEKPVSIAINEVYSGKLTMRRIDPAAEEAAETGAES